MRVVLSKVQCRGQETPSKSTFGSLDGDRRLFGYLLRSGLGIFDSEYYGQLCGDAPGDLDRRTMARKEKAPHQNGAIPKKYSSRSPKI